MVKIAVRGIRVVQEDEGLWDTTVYGKRSSEDELVDVLVQVFLCSSKIIKSSALPPHCVHLTFEYECMYLGSLEDFLCFPPCV